MKELFGEDVKNRTFPTDAQSFYSDDSRVREGSKAAE